MAYQLFRDIGAINRNGKQVSLVEQLLYLRKRHLSITRFTVRDYMTIFRILAVFLSVTVVCESCPISIGAQPLRARESVSTSVSIEPQNNRFAFGERPITVIMTIKNNGQQGECFSTDPSLYRIHVTNKGSEPPKTEFHRHRLGDFRPGDGPELMPGPVDCRPITPGSQDSRKYDLARFYDLSEPGDYSVYIEIYDPQGPQDGSGFWLRTNTAHFTVGAQAK